MSEFITVKVTMICEKTVEFEVSIPIESLLKDGDGIYSFDEIQEVAQNLAQAKIRSDQEFDSISLDAAEIARCPDDFDWWT